MNGKVRILFYSAALGSVDVSLWAQALAAMPKDTKLCGIEVDFNFGARDEYMVLESSDFHYSTTPNLPIIEANFYKNYDGSSTFKGIEWHGTLKNKPSQYYAVGGGVGATTNTAPVNTSNENNPSPQVSGWNSYVPSGCLHQFETYHGLNDIFEHCTKCGVKK